MAYCNISRYSLEKGAFISIITLLIKLLDTNRFMLSYNSLFPQNLKWIV